MKLKQVVLMVGLLVMVALLAGCQPITAEGMVSALAGQPVENAAAVMGETATATVTARSLRVRAEPSESAEVVAGIREGEQYAVIGRSSDGLWIQLEIPRAVQGNGWVSANFVTVQGPITDAAVSDAPAAATPVPTEEAAEAAPTEAPAEEATPAPTEEAAEAAPTEAPAEEAAPAVTPEPGFALVTAEGARLRVRAEPSIESAIVGWVQPGEIVPVEEVSADGLWVKLGGVADTENPDGGWVSAEFVVVGQ